MELSQLEYFRVLGRLQHVTRAAEELGIAQPTLSRSMARLETELGVPLLRPIGRSVELSEFGIAFFAFVERALDELHQGRLRLAEMNRAEEHTISLGFLRSLAPHFVPDLARRFRLKYPSARFVFTNERHDQLIASLLAGDITICITARTDDARVEWRPVAQQTLVVIVPPDHRLAQRKSVAVAELAGEPFVMFKRGYRSRKEIDALLRAAGVVPTVVSESAESGSLRALVAAGSGVAIVAASGANSDVVTLTIDDPVAAREIGIAWVPGSHLSPAELAFRSFVVEEVTAGVSTIGRTSGRPHAGRKAL